MRFAPLLAAAAIAAVPTTLLAQGRDSEDYRDGYRRGYDDGFAAGFRKALEDGARAPVPVAPPPAAPRPGPINITRAVYGSSSRSCDATEYARRQAQGRMSASFEVTNTMCGDPAKGDRKEIEVTYVCGRGGPAKTASAREHRSVYLDCTS